MIQNNSLAIILAAGKGTRMKQSVPKPLVNVLQKPIISWIIESFKNNNVDIGLVINPKHQIFFNQFKQSVSFIYQKEQKGTGHAVAQASDKIKDYDQVYVFVGDSPFIKMETISKMFNQHTLKNNDVTILSSIFEERKFPYARIVRDNNNNLVKIVEEIDASDKELQINELFCSHYLFKSKILSYFLNQLKQNSKTGEIYFTDILNHIIVDKKNIGSIIVDDWKELVGLNSKQDIKWAELQKKI